MPACLHTEKPRKSKAVKIVDNFEFHFNDVIKVKNIDKKMTFLIMFIFVQTLGVSIVRWGMQVLILSTN